VQTALRAMNEVQGGNPPATRRVVLGRSARRVERTEMIGLLLIALLVLTGPLALVIGVDSRRDEGLHGWPRDR
jgi:hypothetical protein